MKKIFLLIFLIPCFQSAICQAVAINTDGSTPDASSILDIKSSSKGVLFPRMTTAQRKAITSPAVGLLVFDLDKKVFYMYDGNKWNPMMFATSDNKLPASPIDASDGLAGDSLGYSVSISGNYAIVGAPRDDVGANADQGSAYIFFRSNGVWTQQAKLTASDGAALDLFGSSVSIKEDSIVVVGAPGDDVGANINQGSVYVFHRTGTVWSQLAKLTASDGAANDSLGNSVGVSGDYIVAGAKMDDVGANTDQGSAYVFFRTAGTNNWPQQAKLTAASGAANDQFGTSVAISGDYIIAGAPFKDSVINTASADIGMAYVFHRVGTTWPQQAKLFDSTVITDGAIFGTGVSITTNNGTEYASVGAPNNDNGAFNGVGAAFIFIRSGTTWNQQIKLSASDGVAYGICVDISGDYLIVGDSSNNIPVPSMANSVAAGAACLYHRNGTAWDFVRKVYDDDPQNSEFYGFSAGVDAFNLIVGGFGKNNNKGQVFFLNFE